MTTALQMAGISKMLASQQPSSTALEHHKSPPELVGVCPHPTPTGINVPAPTASLALVSSGVRQIPRKRPIENEAALFLLTWRGQLDQIVPML